MAVDYKKIGLVNTKEMFARAIKGGWAVPAFNFNNLEQLQAIIQASSNLKSLRGEDSRLLQQRTGFQRTALHIENMHRSARRQSQLLRGNIRQQPVPFAVFSVPQNCRVRCAFPQVFRRGAEIFRGIAENAFPLICHIAVTPVIQWSRRLRPRQTCQDGNS